MFAELVAWYEVRLFVLEKSNFIYKDGALALDSLEAKVFGE